MVKALGACLLLLAPSALAQKLSVLNFTGPDAVVVRVQIAQGVCQNRTCVDPKKVSKGWKPDWAKAKKEKVGLIITGAIRKKGAKRTTKFSASSVPWERRRIRPSSDSRSRDSCGTPGAALSFKGSRVLAPMRNQYG